ncbi:MAG: oxidoreductase [Opitutae bacterium]|nr:oxidoreductase [Opitutae bacterium]
MKNTLRFLPLALAPWFATAPAGQFSGKPGEVKIMTLDPGHFHAALVQKSMYPQVDPKVYVYAPAGDDVQEHLKRIDGYNSRQNQPCRWQESIYTGPDFFAKMLQDRPGNVMVTAGNNRKKTEYIKATIEAGINVLADKPMAIDAANFELLRQAFATAEKKGVFLYDIMTERHEVTTQLQKEFSLLPEVFGTLEKGTPEQPAVTKESVHHFYKFVSGSALKRPAWFFDVTQQGEGIVDVTTHLVDLIQWECFPDQTLDYTKDIQVLTAKRWATPLTAAEFNAVTKLSGYPDYLKKDLQGDTLRVYSNGEINYRIKGVHAKVSVTWNYKAPDGAGDTHFSIMRGTKANLVIRQGAEQSFKPVLYIEPAPCTDLAALGQALTANLVKVQAQFPGVELKKLASSWQVVVPERYNVGHEAHFSQVTEKFLKYLAQGRLPEWEVPNMIAKYYTTTKALELAKQSR